MMMKSFIWIFAGAIGIIILTTGLIWGEKHHKESTQILKIKLKSIVLPIVFTLLISTTMLSYGALNILTASKWYNAAICSVYLVSSWIIVEKIYELMDNKENYVLNEKEKNFCHVIAGLSIFLLFVMLGRENTDYLMVSSVVISILIGAYIPINDIFEGKKIGYILLNIFRDIFKEIPIKTMVGTIVTAGIFVFTSFNEAKVYDTLNYLGIGILIGGLIIILSLEIWSKIHTDSKQSALEEKKEKRR